ncbi:MAG: Sec-independent protein translocase TatC, partial [Halobacteriaceae archaeon]
EDTMSAINSGRETLGVTLRTIQKRLQKVFIAFLIGLLVGIMGMRDVVWPELKEDLLVKGASVIAQTPFDVILLQVKIGLLFGILLALPVLLYYMREPLQERGILRRVPVSRWKAILITILATLLFFGGAVYAYVVFFPFMFAFLANNALSAGLTPMYSIVAWTQFILVLGISFGFAAQMPLIMTALSYSGIVRYETFRDNWRYAVVIIFMFGAIFSPPDPFTQLMWAMPLLTLYGFSLYLTKIVVTAKRGSDQVSILGTVRQYWNRIVGFGVLGGGIIYFIISSGALAYFNSTIRQKIPGFFRPPRIQPNQIIGIGESVDAFLISIVIGIFVMVIAFLYYLYISLGQVAMSGSYSSTARDEMSQPENIDLTTLDAEGIRAAPPEAFEGLTEDEALKLAEDALDENKPKKAQAIIDRYEETTATAESDSSETATDDETEGEESTPPSETGFDLSDRVSEMADILTEEETTEEDIGGYYRDVRFIINSLRSRAFRIAAIFLLVLGGTFTGLYAGGIGILVSDFLSRLPPEVAQDEIPFQVITLHPVEALIFEVKISTVMAIISIIPFLVYYAWPSLSERGLVGGDRNTLWIWGGAIITGLLVGSAIGYLYVAPTVISWLVYDAIKAGMIISYRVSNFFWLVFLTTAGIGIFVDIPITMWLFHSGNIISYRTMRKRWRGVVIGVFVFAAIVTPESVYTMLIVGLPMILAYWIGLGGLWLATTSSSMLTSKSEA